MMSYEYMAGELLKEPYEMTDAEIQYYSKFKPSIINRIKRYFTKSPAAPGQIRRVRWINNYPGNIDVLCFNLIKVVAVRETTIEVLTYSHGTGWSTMSGNDPFDIDTIETAYPVVISPYRQSKLGLI